MLGVFVHLLSITEERCSNKCIHILNAVPDVTAFFVPVLHRQNMAKGLNLHAAYLSLYVMPAESFMWCMAT
jgi:hypothetical protein